MLLWIVSWVFSGSKTPKSIKHWKQPLNRNNIARIGVTEFAQKRFEKILFVELPELETEFEQFDSFGVVESEKMVSEVFIPISGKVLSINEELEEDPTLINHDPYGDGWLAEIEIVNEDETKNLMDSEEYEQFVNSGGDEEL